MGSDQAKRESSRALAREWPWERQKPFEDHLRKAAASWFRGRKLKTHPKMPYCLEKHEQWPRNLVLDEVASYIRAKARPVGPKGDSAAKPNAFPLHKYLHHGLSSQAMLFNLIGPLVERSDLQPLQLACETAGIPWPAGAGEPEFEHDDRCVFNEDSGQPTSIDLAIPGDAPLFIEAKLTEKEFGGCSVFQGGDCEGLNPIGDMSTCYLHHIGRKYWCRLKEQGMAEGALKAERICPLACYYQFFRELLYALHKHGHFVLLYEERSAVFVRRHTDGSTSPRGLWPLLSEFVPETLRSRLHLLTIQQVVKAIERSGRHDDWIGEFRAKYGLPKPQTT